jgi:uncharacterized membrane-anchored protein YjiN (DUF445 family)
MRAPDPPQFGGLPDLDATDRRKLADLTRIKALATGVLVLCFLLMVAAKFAEPIHPVFGFVAAFMEAATIGGLADWYAVVALFRHPMGLPIPHTAIIPENQARIGDNLGAFIETQFLAPAPVAAKLREVDFAAHVADWLADPDRSRELAGFVVKLVPQTVAAIEQSGLKGFVTARMIEQIEKVPVAPLAADLLTTFTDDRRHQKLLDEVLTGFGAILRDEGTLALLKDRIREEVPTLFAMFRGDAYLLGKIVHAATTLFEEVHGDPDHPLRAEFDRFVGNFVERLRDSPDYAERAEKLKRDLLDRPELRDLAEDMWLSLRAFIEQDSRSDTSAIFTHLQGLLTEIGRHLATEPRLRNEMNEGFVVALGAFVETQKSGVSRFIADQVKGWDMAQLIRLIEINIGRDLQYIRFNGMLIGGIAGLVLHLVEVLLRLN